MAKANNKKSNKVVKASKKETKRTVKPKRSVRTLYKVTQEVIKTGLSKVLRVNVPIPAGRKKNELTLPPLYIASKAAWGEWLGFLQADGHVGINVKDAKRGLIYPHIIFRNTDPRLLASLSSVVPGFGNLNLKAQKLASGKWYGSLTWTKTLIVVALAREAIGWMSASDRRDKLALVARFPIFLNPGKEGFTPTQIKRRKAWLKEWKALLKKQERDLKKFDEKDVKRRVASTGYVRRLRASVEEARKNDPFSGVKTEKQVKVEATSKSKERERPASQRTPAFAKAAQAKPKVKNQKAKNIKTVTKKRKVKAIKKNKKRKS